MTPKPPASPVLRWLAKARDTMALAVGIGAFILVASYCAGCASTGGLAGAAIAAKPILDTTCAGARVACRLIDSACSAYEGSAGGEAP